MAKNSDGAYFEWGEDDFDPNDVPDWDIGDELDGDEPDPSYAAFVENLHDRLDSDIGYASEPDSLELLARMYVEDRPNYARAEQILRSHKLLSLVRSSVRQRARQLSNIESVPGGGEALKLIRIRDEYPDAPVHPDAVVPASWIVDGKDDGPQRYRLVKKVVKRREGGHYVEYVGVSYSPLVISAIMVDVADDATNLRISWPSRGKWRHRVVPRSRLLQPREMLAALGDTQGFPGHGNNAKDLISYLADYEAFNEEIIPSRPMTRHMGWQGKGGRLGFIAGSQHIKADDDAPDVHFVGADDGDQQLVRCVKAQGSFDGWRRAAKIASKFPMVELAIYAALAPPLLSILRAKNFTIDWAHKTTGGKTTTISLAASCWGNPDENASDTFIGSWEMTTVGFERRAAALTGMPMVVDDSKRARKYRGDTAIPGIIYMMANGSGRARGSVKGMAKLSSWRTVMLSTGEQRLIDFDKSGGTPARVVSIWGRPFVASSPMIAEAIRKLKSGILANYGHAGPAFVRYLLEHRDEWPEWRETHSQRWSELREMMAEECIGRTMDVAVLDRIACNLAVIDVTAQLAHRALDLPWELKSVIDEIVPIVAPAAGAVDRELEALRTVVSWAAANRGKFAYSENHRRQEEPPGGWLGFWEAADRDGWSILAFFPGALKEKLIRDGFEPTAIFRQWAEAGWLMSKESGRLTSRVSELGGRPRMIVLPREIVEGPGGLSTDSAAEPGQEEMPF